MQLLLNLIKQVERILSITVQLIDKNNHRRLTHATNFHQFTSLRLDTLSDIDHDNYTVYRRQGTERILCEILVTRRIEDIDLMIGIVERHHGSRDRDTTLFLDLHPVGSRRLLDLIRLNRTCHVNGATKQQQFLGQGCLTRIRVTDNRECPSPFNFRRI